MTNKFLYQRLFKYIRAYRYWVIGTIVAMFASAVLNPMLAYTVKPLLDVGFLQKDKIYIIGVPIAIVVLMFSKAIADYFLTLLTEKVSQNSIASIRAEIYARLHTLPATFFDNQNVGKLISKVSYDTTQIGLALSKAWIIIIRDSLTILALTLYLFWVSWELSLSLLALFPIAFWVIKIASNKMRNRADDVQQHMGKMTQTLEEGISGHKEIKIYAAEKQENHRFKEVVKQVAKNMIAISQVSVMNVQILQVVAAVTMAVQVFLAATLSSLDILTVGDFFTFIVAMALIFEPLQQLTTVNTELQKGLAAATSVFSLLDQPAEPNNGKKLFNKQHKVKGDIDFENLDFSYQSVGKPLFENFNLHVKANSTIAIVGESGSGKSTLGHLLARFYEPQKGKILIDNQDIQSIDLVSLREQIMLVNQHVMLFNDTIQANIAYGINQNATDEEIQQVAKLANADEFINQLPEGYQTYVGDKGTKLSGGQRQRIGLARAFLKNAPIMLLDEASSALDNRTSLLIRQAIERLSEGRTTFIIAHQLETIQHVEHIIVLDKGKIIEQGSHQQLMQKSNVYARLYEQIKNH